MCAQSSSQIYSQDTERNIAMRQTGSWTHFFCVSPARTRILCTCKPVALGVSLENQWNRLEKEKPLYSSHRNVSFSRSPMSVSVTTRKECVLFTEMLSSLFQREEDKTFLTITFLSFLKKFPNKQNRLLPQFSVPETCIFSWWWYTAQ
ncbi:hypothetical protein JZ751_014186 [Albula glossodonta]|uniref:Uncharacterized protein n=1 Tax=Albula glossodonta TaxID=121402 RepID=A0A8T2P3J0_9TELE|nr:hypothetical protein JZ751_014186 [Albula glossodonta]